MIPKAKLTSSMLAPIAPATGATYLKLSPSISTFVFALDDAAAMTSARCPASSALYPIAVSASVTISDVVAKSAPLAAARFRIPSIPLIICSDFQPAMPMYSKASLASVAENFVVAPICLAFWRKLSISSPVAPEIACTFDRLESKDAPTLIDAAASSLSLLIP